MSDVLELIRKYTAKAPVDIDGLIKAAGVELVYQPLGEDDSGWIERLDNDGYRIVVNSKHSRVRQRFTAAHEFGHYIFHRELMGRGASDNRAYRSTSKFGSNSIFPVHETQANRVAANLLMPMALLLERKDESIYVLAMDFEVSEQAMRIRLKGVRSE